MIKECELIRTLELKDVVITSLNFINIGYRDVVKTGKRPMEDDIYNCIANKPVGKFILVGTNNGITAFYESDTGKLNGTYS